MKKFYLLIAVLISYFAPSASANPSRFAMERDIREVALRQQFKHVTFDPKLPPPVYFLAIGEKQIDPSDEFMKRFKSHKPVVKKVSQSIRVEQSKVRDKATGEGEIFSAGAIKSRTKPFTQVTQGLAWVSGHE